MGRLARVLVEVSLVEAIGDTDLVPDPAMVDEYSYHFVPPMSTSLPLYHRSSPSFYLEYLTPLDMSLFFGGLATASLALWPSLFDPHRNWSSFLLFARQETIARLLQKERTTRWLQKDAADKQADASFLYWQDLKV